MTFDQYIRGVEDVFTDLANPITSQTIVIELSKPLEGLIVDLNTKNQLQQQGTDGTGTPVRPPYRPRTIRYKRRKGQPTNRVTLKDTGAFHNSFKVVFRGAEMEIMATDPKTGKLLEKYGKEVLGLDDSSLQTLRDKLKPLLIERQRNELLNAQ